MDRSTVSRILSLFHSTGAVSKKVFAKDRSFRILTEPGQLLILHLVTNKPGVYLREIQEELLLQLMIEVAISTICRFLNKNGFSYQKMAHIAIQRDEYFRQKYLMDVSVYQPEMFIFIDETGADQRNCLRQFGYSVRGIPIQKHSMFVRGQRISALCYLSEVF